MTRFLLRLASVVCGPVEGRTLWLRMLAVSGLLVWTFLIYSPALSAQFVNWDDNLYVTDVPRIGDGLTYDNIRWSWTTLEPSNYHPLMWLSLLLDAEVHGLDPRGFP